MTGMKMKRELKYWEDRVKRLKKEIAGREAQDETTILSEAGFTQNYLGFLKNELEKAKARVKELRSI